MNMATRRKPIPTWPRPRFCRRRSCWELPWQEDVKRVADIYSDTLDRVLAERCALEISCRGAANVEIVGRDAAYGAAAVSALCIREVTGLWAMAHTGAGFRHGPNLDMDGTHVGIVFCSRARNG
jgi:glucosamine--fructose-6-phosphate aminotransferase (isomerizing)